MKIHRFFKIILLATLMELSCKACAQNNKIDSLQKHLQTQSDDTAKVNTLIALAYEIRYYRADIEKSMQYALAALKLAEKLQFKEGIAYAYRQIGGVHAVGVKYKEALENYFHALKIFNEIENEVGKASVYNSIGHIYAEQGRYAEARSYNLTALKIREEIGDKKEIAYSYEQISDLFEREENYPEALTYAYMSLKLFDELDDSSGIARGIYIIGWIEYKQGNYVEAQKNYLRALNTFEALGDTFMTATMYRNMGEILFLLGDYEAALKNNLIALRVFEKVQLKLSMAWVYNGIGNIYERQGLLAHASGSNVLAKTKHAKALQYHVMALEVWKEANDKGNISETYINISNVHKYLNNITEAKRNLQLCWPIALQIQSKALFKSYYQSLSQLDSLEGNYKQAYRHYKKYIDYRDSLVNEETIKHLSQAKMQYEFDKKEAVAKTIQERKDAEQKRLKNLQYFTIGGLGFAVITVLLIAFLQWRNSSNKQKANVLLQRQKEEIQTTLSELKSTQAQLIQSEKMASLGELTAGIAHEIQNPLNFVNNFSEVNAELIDEAEQEIDKGNISEVKVIFNDIKENGQKIYHHGKRADAIVKGMLQHSRSSTGQRELTDICALTDEYIKLSYHGLRAKGSDFDVTIKRDLDESIGKIYIIPQDIGRVLLNLFNNALYTLAEKSNQEGEGYEPYISVSTKKINNLIEIRVRDNGKGIPQKIVDKIFQPFFTTKPTGQGTGLGLSFSYDIIKAHGGDIKVETREGMGSEFIIHLPIV